MTSHKRFAYTSAQKKTGRPRQNHFKVQFIPRILIPKTLDSFRPAACFLDFINEQNRRSLLRKSTCLHPFNLKLLRAYSLWRIGREDMSGKTRFSECLPNSGSFSRLPGTKDYLNERTRFS